MKESVMFAITAKTIAELVGNRSSRLWWKCFRIITRVQWKCLQCCANSQVAQNLNLKHITLLYNVARYLLLVLAQV